MSEPSHVGIVHRDDAGVLHFDDLAVPTAAEIPRSRAYGGTLWYADDTVRASDLTALIGPEDEALGARPGELRRAEFRIPGKKPITVCFADTWGVRSRDAEETRRAIEELRILAEIYEMPVKASAAATGISTYLDRWDGDDEHPPMRQLPCRWRGMARAAFHGGPIAVLRGGADHAIQIDVRRAYLDALEMPVPVLGDDVTKTGYACPTHLHWPSMRDREGFVDATVTVHVPEEGLPPLPVQSPLGILYPRGRIRGCWTLGMLRDAEARNEVDVEIVHQAALARQLRPLFEEIGTFFASLPDALSRVSYTRFWARWGTAGGWIGERREAPEHEGEIVPAGGLWWRYDGIGILDPAAPRTYRPDIAALIAANNHRRVMTALAQLDSSSIVAVHVDAIWTTDPNARVIAAPPDAIARNGEWRVKREGPLRFWGAGCYDHDGSLGASGYDPATLGAPTRARLEQWIRTDSGRRRILQQRQWTGDPATDAAAFSTSIRMNMDDRAPVTQGPDVKSSCWTPRGWIRAIPE